MIQLYATAAILACVLTVGCGRSDGPARIPLEGTVTSTNISEPLNGTIAVLPTDGTKGPAANGVVTEGEYAFDDSNGPVAGKHKVLVDVQPPRGKMDKANSRTDLQWKFEFQITVPSEAPFTSDFELVRKHRHESM